MEPSHLTYTGAIISAARTDCITDEQVVHFTRSMFVIISQQNGDYSKVQPNLLAESAVPLDLVNVILTFCIWPLLTVQQATISGDL